MFNWKNEHKKKLRMLKSGIELIKVPKLKNKFQLWFEWIKFLIFGIEKKGVIEDVGKRIGMQVRNDCKS